MTRLFGRVPIGLVSVALALAPAHGAPPPAPPDNEVVVEAQRNALRSFVESFANAGLSEQLARWKDEICPVVAGIDAAEAQWIEQRILELGKTVGLRRGPSNCAPSIIVLIDPEPDKLAKAVANNIPRDDGLMRLRHFVASDRPVRWVTVTDECGDGCSLPNSRLVKATTPTFAGILILVDARRLSGVSLGELADYLALVALTNPRNGRQNPPGSVLSMFDRPRLAGAPYALTGRDLGFLAGLYRTQYNDTLQAQKRVIEQEMRKRLKQTPSQP